MQTNLFENIKAYNQYIQLQSYRILNLVCYKIFKSIFKKHFLDIKAVYIYTCI